MAQKTVDTQLKGIRNWLIGLTVLGAATTVLIVADSNSGKKDVQDRVYLNMKIGEDELRSLFVQESGGDPNEIKTVVYEWYELNGIYALSAYGADNRGRRLSRRVDLTIPDRTAYQVIKDFERRTMATTRGELKYMLNSTLQDRDEVIEDDLYEGLEFSAAIRECIPGENAMCYEIKCSSTGKSESTNPAPPFSFTTARYDARNP